MTNNRDTSRRSIVCVHKVEDAPRYLIVSTNDETRIVSSIPGVVRDKNILTKLIRKIRGL